MEIRNNPIFQKFFVPSHSRGVNYVVGMIFGYIFYKLQWNDDEISKIKSGIIAIVSAGIMICSVLWSIKYYNFYSRLLVFEIALYTVIHRVVFVICFGVLLILLAYTESKNRKRIFSYYFYRILFRISSEIPVVTSEKL